MLRRWGRAGVVTGLLVLAWALGAGAGAQTLALSFEGGFDPTSEPRAGEWNAALLKALKQARVQALLLPHGQRVDSEEGLALVREWGEQGHLIGNMTYAQRDYGSPRTSFADFRQDLLAAQALLEDLPGWTRWFRAPGLREGDSADKRDRLRDWLRLHGYRWAAVTIDPLDALYDRRWRAWQAAHPGQDDAALQEAYLNHVWGRANEREALARRVLGRSPAHLLRLQANALNAETLPELIRLFRRKGWTVVSPQQAYRDGLYEREPAVVPAGGSLVVALGRQMKLKGLRTPEQDLQQEQRRLDRRGWGAAGDSPGAAASRGGSPPPAGGGTPPP